MNVYNPDTDPYNHPFVRDLDDLINNIPKGCLFETLETFVGDRGGVPKDVDLIMPGIECQKCLGRVGMYGDMIVFKSPDWQNSPSAE